MITLFPFWAGTAQWVFPVGGADGASYSMPSSLAVSCRVCIRSPEGKLQEETRS
ncbi:MAG: hypothetical protein OXI58_11780 [Gemmatimonadota bacterium]|nr:hypothetical protein [Gemmatimonadota bacterium]